MEKAIKKAVEGGYMKGREISEVSVHGSFWLTSGKGIKDLITWQHSLFDPIFWQALVIGAKLYENIYKNRWANFDARTKELAIKDEAIRYHEMLVRYIHNSDEYADVNGWLNNLLK